MKSLVSTSGTFEPFNVITKLANEYDCDGVIYPFSVVGNNCAIVDYVAPPPTPKVPEWVEPLQLDEALIDFGLYDAIYAYVGQATNIEKAKFHRAKRMYRNDPFLVGGAKNNGMTDAQIDAVFILAATK